MYQIMTNVMVKAGLNRKFIKKSDLIQAMKNTACPKPKFIRSPNLSENRTCPKTECSEVWIEHTT